LSTGESQRRVCLLTGAGGLLGSQFCQSFADEYDIVAVCRTRAPAVPSQSETFVDPLSPDQDVPENRHPVFVLRADLEKDGEVDRVVDIALARYDRVDLLVNNAAYSNWPTHGMVDGDAALRDFDRHFAMNVRVPMELSVRLAQRFWMQHDLDNRSANRNIVNVSSLAGSRVYPHRGQGVYAASKAALNQLTRHLGSEFAPFGVRVNAVAPNSFPAIVSTASVAKAIRKLDQETVTGAIMVLDSAG
jgi:NAD(P)-dependent dehydrogenase (short-subunit alcohol dehydrogenase family)